MTADFLACAALFLGLLDPLARLCTRLLPHPRDAIDPAKPLYLSGETAPLTCVRLATAEREVLRIVDMVESMLRIFLYVLRDDDRKLLAEFEPWIAPSIACTARSSCFSRNHPAEPSR